MNLADPKRNQNAVMRSLFIAACVALGAIATSPSRAAGPNDSCLMCHSDPAAKNASGKSLGLVPARFSASVHGALGLKCTDCHRDASAAKLPHAPKLKPVDCAGCHDTAVKEYAATVHGKARAGGNPVAAACGDCHGATHEVLPSSNPHSRTNRVNLEGTCGGCHGNEKIVAQAHLPGGNVQAKYHDSTHGRLIREAGVTATMVPTCTTCHGTHGILSKSESASRVARKNIPDTCGACHQRQHAIYDQGLHGKLQHAGNPAAPVCTDCHSAHTIERARKPEWQVALIGQCGNCHDEYISSYRRTYHGKVTDLGFADMATCASCHGAHDVRPASDPLSTVSPQNRLQTCRNCHKNAGAQFVSWDPHPRPADRNRSPVLYLTNTFMQVLLAGVFVFFGLHTGLWAYRSIGDVLRRRREGADSKENR